MEAAPTSHLVFFIDGMYSKGYIDIAHLGSWCRKTPKSKCGGIGGHLIKRSIQRCTLYLAKKKEEKKKKVEKKREKGGKRKEKKKEKEKKKKKKRKDVR